jgi:hypothetical protein
MKIMLFWFFCEKCKTIKTGKKKKEIKNYISHGMNPQPSEYWLWGPVVHIKQQAPISIMKNFPFDFLGHFWI